MCGECFYAHCTLVFCGLLLSVSVIRCPWPTCSRAFKGVDLCCSHLNPFVQRREARYAMLYAGEGKGKGFQNDVKWPLKSGAHVHDDTHINTASEERETSTRRGPTAGERKQVKQTEELSLSPCEQSKPHKEGVARGKGEEACGLASCTYTEAYRSAGS